MTYRIANGIDRTFYRLNRKAIKHGAISDTVGSVTQYNTTSRMVMYKEAIT